ncbi:MAG: hypothetical protein NVS2B16_18600 [Chloroflexota bacterium]
MCGAAPVLVVAIGTFTPASSRIDVPLPAPRSVADLVEPRVLAPALMRKHAPRVIIHRYHVLR